jgi:peroxiredoxin
MTDVGAFLGGPTTITGREPLLGEAASAFQLPGEDGKKVSLQRLTLRGPLLMHFYRGNW